MDGDKREHNIIFYNNKEAPGIVHSGDNRTGNSEADDEMIRIDLDEIEEQSKELYLVVNIFTDGGSFSDVNSAYIRLCLAKDDGKFSPGGELARYTLDSGLTTRGLIFSKLIRKGKKWSVVAIGAGCNGKKGTDDETIEACKAQISA